MNGSENMMRSRVMTLIIINVVVYFIQMAASVYTVEYSVHYNNQLINVPANLMTYYFGLIPVVVINKLFLWQISSYMFLHGGFFHLFLNMYALLIFGIPIEQAWGSKKFLGYYFFTGVGAGLTIFIINLIMKGSGFFFPTIGASGAVFGLLLAFGILYPDAEILLFFIMPLKAKYLVVLYGGIELFSLYSAGGDSGISHIGHLGGLVFGLIYFAFAMKRGIQFKTKKLKAVLQQKLERKPVENVPGTTENAARLAAIYKKVKYVGPDSLDDNEYQFLKYMEIMNDGDDDSLCVDEDFSIDDSYCRKCASVEACLLRAIKKYL